MFISSGDAFHLLQFEDLRISIYQVEVLTMAPHEEHHDVQLLDRVLLQVLKLWPKRQRGSRALFTFCLQHGPHGMRARDRRERRRDPEAAIDRLNAAADRS